MQILQEIINNPKTNLSTLEKKLVQIVAQLIIDWKKLNNWVKEIGNRWIGNSVYVFRGGRNQSDIMSGRFNCSSYDLRLLERKI